MELVGRYRFHLAMQAIPGALEGVRAQLNGTSRWLSSRSEFS